MSDRTEKLMQPDLLGAPEQPFRYQPKEISVKTFGGPDMVRVSPSAWAWKPTHADKVPKYGRVRWVANGDGTFRPVPNDVRFVIVSRDVLDEIGFRNISKSVSDTTLRRLSQAQEILMFHVSPRVRMLDLDSWWRYIDECIANPEKWEEGSESWSNYMFRNALGEHRKTMTA